MDNLADLLKKRRPGRPSRDTEREELVSYFRNTVNEGRIGTKYKPLPPGFFRKRLESIPTKDLYALKSRMIDGERRGVAASAIFFFQLKPPAEITSH